ncbi:hypothetical protein C5167_040989 [Papaver somniferum]|uniref:Homeobox domain-containing protein n=1 Tax=Papaver somniferum TaxID=3469 RepID=A0A4Y7IJV7_PAPSO|nr:homeobox-leucine zipper protein HAT4-like [Papaver somniferum]RZC48040.1 hypothetical protein C5167_040989 [Papaver somniferum]
MVGMEDLGLSLSLSSTNHHHNLNALQLNLMPTSSPFSHQQQQHHQKSSPWINMEQNLEMYRGETRSFLRGIDVNRMPQKTMISTIDNEEEEGGNSSPNSTLSSLSGKRSLRDLEGGSEENYDMERACSRGISDEEDGGSDTRNSNKKLRLSKDQSALLEDSFKENNTLNPKQKVALAKQLNLRPRQVEVWFQNRRARTKLKQTEVDCEFLKRSCENLAEENRRLQKEVQELRALKMSPQFYMQMTPPTTLTMCPSCERVATSAVDHPPQQHTHQMMSSSPHNHHQRPNSAINNRVTATQARSMADRSMLSRV